MKCPACAGAIEPGKLLLCVACFESLPHKEQVATRQLYVRLVRLHKDPRKVAAGMASKVEKLARMAREARAIALPETAIKVVHAPGRTETMKDFLGFKFVVSPIVPPNTVIVPKLPAPMDYRQTT